MKDSESLAAIRRLTGHLAESRAELGEVQATEAELRQQIRRALESGTPVNEKTSNKRRPRYASSDNSPLSRRGRQKPGAGVPALRPLRLRRLVSSPRFALRGTRRCAMQKKYVVHGGR
jgi:hypothetical protein